MVYPVSERSIILVPEEHNNGTLGILIEKNRNETEVSAIVWYGEQNPPTFPQNKENWNQCYDYSPKSLLVAYPEVLGDYKKLIKKINK